MQILFINFLSLFLSAPLFSQRNFQGLYHWEETQIFLDNAGILLAREDTALFNAIVLLNKSLQQWDIVHHTYHYCPTPPCQMADKNLEVKLSLEIQMARRSFIPRWIYNRQKVEAYLREKKISFQLNGRPLRLPIFERRCIACGFVKEWALISHYWKYEWKYLQNQYIQASTLIDRKRNHWDYYLLP